MIGIGFFDNAVSQASRILVHLVGLGPGHYDHRDGSLGTDGFDVLLEILLEERHPFFAMGSLDMPCKKTTSNIFGESDCT